MKIQFRFVIFFIVFYVFKVGVSGHFDNGRVWTLSNNCIRRDSLPKMEIHTKNANVLGKSALSNSMICEWTDLFKSSGPSSRNDPREYRLKTESTPESFQRCWNIFGILVVCISLNSKMNIWSDFFKCNVGCTSSRWMRRL